MTAPENHYHLFHVENMGKTVLISTQYNGFRAAFTFVYERDRKAYDDFGNETFSMHLEHVNMQDPNRASIAIRESDYPECDNNEVNLSLERGIHLIHHTRRWSIPDVVQDKWYKRSKLRHPNEATRWHKIGKQMYAWTKEQAKNNTTFEGFLENLPSTGLDFYVSIEEN
jgi:hypothetical protein